MFVSIVGSKGFLGSNLVKSLRNIDDIIVFEVFRRGTENINPNEFQNEIKKSDFIIYGAENADRSQTDLGGIDYQNLLINNLKKFIKLTNGKIIYLSSSLLYEQCTNKIEYKLKYSC